MRTMIDTSLESHRRVMVDQTAGGTGLEAQAWRDTSPEGRLRVIAATAHWLQAERQRGLARHWTYSLPRHRAVHKAWEIEKKLWEGGGK